MVGHFGAKDQRASGERVNWFVIRAVQILICAEPFLEPGPRYEFWTTIAGQTY